MFISTVEEHRRDRGAFGVTPQSIVVADSSCAGVLSVVIDTSRRPALLQVVVACTHRPLGHGTVCVVVPPQRFRQQQRSNTVTAKCSYMSDALTDYLKSYHLQATLYCYMADSLLCLQQMLPIGVARPHNRSHNGDDKSHNLMFLDICLKLLTPNLHLLPPTSPHFVQSSVQRNV